MKKDGEITQPRSATKLFNQAYAMQRLKSKKRGKPMPTYTWHQLRNWIDQQPNAQQIWNDWVQSGYQQDLCPSIDRIDDNQWYTLSNIQLLTAKDNRTKGHQARYDGTLSSGIPHKSIAAYYPDGSLQGEYPSVSEAARRTGMSPQTIGRHA